MGVHINVNDILSQAEKLGKDEQLTLLQRLAQLVKKGQGNSFGSTKLISLNGLGSEVWRDTNIDTYLNQERQW